MADDSFICKNDSNDTINKSHVIRLSNVIILKP